MACCLFLSDVKLSGLDYLVSSTRMIAGSRLAGAPTALQPKYSKYSSHVIIDKLLCALSQRRFYRQQLAFEFAFVDSLIVGES